MEGGISLGASPVLKRFQPARRGNGARAFFAIPPYLGPPDGPVPPSTSRGDLNKGLLSRPSAPSARLPLTVRLRRRTQQSRCCVLDAYVVAVVPCSGWQPVGVATSGAPISSLPNATTHPASTACGAVTVSRSTPHQLQQFIMFLFSSESCLLSPTPSLAPPGPGAGPAGLPSSAVFVCNLF